MDTTIIIALISGGCTLVGTFAGVVTSSRLTTYRLEQLEKKVQAHNNLIERTYALEEQTALQEEKIKVINHRIKDLETTDRHD
nr:MAG TPA: hemolysin [Caudoviricetes sp.]